MIVRSPAEYYIKFLLAQPEQCSIAQIREVLRIKDLDYPGAAYLEQVAYEMGPRPTPYYPLDPLHQRSMEFLYRNDIRLLFFEDHHTKLAIQLLENTRAKHMLEEGAVAALEPRQMLGLLRRRHHEATEEAVQQYWHFFFNPRLCTVTELRALLSSRPGLTSRTEDDDEARLALMVANSQKHDSRVALSYASSPAIRQYMMLMQHGVLPEAPELKKLLEMGQTAGILRSLDELMRGAPGSDERARNYVQTAQVFMEMLKEVGDPSLALLENLQAVSIQRDTSVLPTIHELSGGGSFTTSVVESSPTDHLENMPDVEQEDLHELEPTGETSE